VTEHDAEEARRLRARERGARMTIRLARLDERESDDERVCGAAGIELAARLTRAAWALSGQPFPTYTREDTPCVFVPNSERE